MSGTTRASFGILGTLEVRVGGEPVAVKAMQQRRLLCVLLLSPGRPVPHGVLAECLWPDDGDAKSLRPRDPGAAVRVYASRLRPMLPKTVGLHGDQRGYSLGVAGDDVDAARFEALVSGAARDLSSDSGRATAVLGEALALWRGPALSEFRDEPWAVGAAVRLDELRLVALERYHDARLAVGEHPELVGELEHLVDEHPLRERFWSQLIRALYGSGRQADALRAFKRLRDRLVEDLGIEPSRELVELEAAVLRQDPALDPPGGSRGTRGTAGDDGAAALEIAPERPVVHHNVPAQLSSFVGREREMAELLDLARRSRLVTLTGPGGSGKTRLAFEVASNLTEAFGDGAWVAELAALRDPGEVEPAVASVLGVKPRVGSPVIETLVEAIRSQHLLLVVDNCEHLISPCAKLCDAILRSCPGVKLLATSREPLGVNGEVIYRVPSLGVPPPGADDVKAVAGQDSVRLFVERAHAQQPAFALSEGNAHIVASLCRRLDGIPLALELAAARLRVLSLPQVHARLDARFSLLVGGARSHLPRQQTLEALIDWSYDLLTTSEQSLLRRLGAFSGGFDLEAAEAVLEESGGNTWGVIDHLASLVDKSLVVAETSGEAARYRLLETIRQYALEKLVAVDGAEALASLHEAHAAVYLALAERAAPLLSTSQQFAWLDRLDLEFDNIRLAIGHFLGKPGSTREAMRIIVALGRFFEWRGHESELLSATEALEGCPELGDQDFLAVRVVLVLSELLGQIEPARAKRRVEGTLEIARNLGETGLVAQVLNRVAWLAWSTGGYAESERLHEEAVSAARDSGEYLPLVNALNGVAASKAERLEALELSSRAGDEISRYMVLCALGGSALDEGEIAAAREYFQRALPIIERARPASDQAPPAVTDTAVVPERIDTQATSLMPELLVNLATALVLGGEPAVARRLYARALDAARRHLDERQAGYGLFGLALCAARDGDPAVAATLHGAAAQQFERAGFALEEAERRLAIDDETRLRVELGEAGFDAARALGQAMSKDDAIDLALGRGRTAAVAGAGGPPPG